MTPRPANSERRKTMQRLEVMLGLRYLTCSCYRGFPLFNEDWVKEEFVEGLARTRAHHHLGLFAWVIMPTHVHLLIIPQLPESPVDAVLNMLKSTMSERVLERMRTIRSLAHLRDKQGNDHFWQPGGGYDRNVRHEQERADIIDYIHNNPVEAGLVATSTDWPWSSARAYAKLRTEVSLDDLQEYRRSEEARLIEKFGSLIEAARAIRALNLDVGPTTGHAKP